MVLVLELELVVQVAQAVADTEIHHKLVVQAQLGKETLEVIRLAEVATLAVAVAAVQIAQVQMELAHLQAQVAQELHPLLQVVQ